MRLLLTVGYSHLLFSKGAEVGRIIEALDHAMLVNEVGPYGHRKFQVESGGEIAVRILAEDCILLPEIKDDSLEVIVKLDKERSDLQVRVYQLEKELKELKVKSESTE